MYSGYEVVSYPITDQLSEEEVVAEDDKGDKGGKDDDGGKGVPQCSLPQIADAVLPWSGVVVRCWQTEPRI